MANVLFIHRSVGRQMLDASPELRELVDDLDINKQKMRQKGDLNKISLTSCDTHAKDLVSIIQDLAALDLIASYDWIVLKSCYSVLNMTSGAVDEELARWKDVMKLCGSLGKHCVVLTPPPRQTLTTLRSRHANDLTFVSRLLEMCRGFAASSFDLHGFLSGDDGYLSAEYRRRLPFDSHPNRSGAEAAASALSAFLADLTLTSPTD